MATVVGREEAARDPLGGTVPEQLRAIMRELQTEGLPFELAWVEGLKRVVWPTSQRETVEWERAMASTKEGWRATYEGWEPLPQELAVAGLPEMLRHLLGP